MEIADPALAGAGRDRIDWAAGQMPVLAEIGRRFARERPLAGVAVGACLHVTPETAVLVRALVDAGAEVALCAANPLSTQDEVAAALAGHGATVHAIRGEDVETYYRHIAATCAVAPAVTMDDGADLASFLHTRRRDLLAGIAGGTEETTSGVVRLRALEADGQLGYPVIATGEARTRRLFDNLYGTGQSVLDGIMRATNVLIAASCVVVVGYGPCGRGIALRASGLGARVVVCEVDPERALEAVMDGHTVRPALAAAREGDVFVTATGGRDALAGEHFEAMRDGALLCNAGHFDVEISKRDLERLAGGVRAVRPLVTQYVVAGGRRLNLVADGRVVNLAAGDGHPAGVMDVSFAGQALSVEHVARAAGQLPAGVHAVPATVDDAVARLKLQALGVELDELTRGQRDYLRSWRQGT